MAQIIKYVAGIDISKDTFEARFGSIDIEQNTKISNSKNFNNSEEGFKALLKWVKESIKDKAPVWFVMEATGVYFENLAFYLSEKDENVNVILPTKVKHYKQSTEVKTKNDRIDANTLTRLGLERQLDEWNVPSEFMRTIKELCREHISLKEIGTQIKNQIHAKKSSHNPNKKVLKRLGLHLALIEKQEKEIESELKKILNTQPEIKQKIELIEQSLKGVGFMTLIKIVAETNGFAFVTNANQLASYAGLDIVENQSGKKQGKTCISSKGNSYLRNSLYMPSLSVVRWVEQFKTFYKRLLEKGKLTKVAQTAVMRKLLLLIFSLWKNNKPFDPVYTKNLIPA